MINKTIKICSATALLAIAVACNSKDDSVINTYSSASTLISSVTIGGNSNSGLAYDSVFFSIDQEDARIFNADSLPYGTSINNIVATITATSASAIELQIPRPGLSDSIVNYTENSTDSIDFSNGPVRIRVTAADGTTSRTYSMSINVHKVKSDTLIWSRAQRANLPSVFQVPERQHTAATASAIYCLTYSNGNWCMASAQAPDAAWTTATPSIPVGARIETFNATDDALYILDSDGALFCSTDGLSWTATGQTWNEIYGKYGTDLWGSVLKNGVWKRVSYPSGLEQDIESNFPVAGTSQTVSYVFEMSSHPQMLLTGGVTASGQYSALTWGFDGSNWACLTTTPLPYALRDPVVVPYFISEFKPGTMRTNRRSALIAMFGERQDGTLNDTVYISHDFGVTWAKAGDELQFPASIPARTKAQGFVYAETMSARSASSGFMAAWTTLGNPRLPFGARFELPMAPASRAADSWECPYVYIFGGENTAGQTYNTLWRGVIRDFTFQPLH